MSYLKWFLTNFLFLSPLLDLFVGQASGVVDLLWPCQGLRKELRDGEDGRAAGHTLLNTRGIPIHQIQGVSSSHDFLITIHHLSQSGVWQPRTRRPIKSIFKSRTLKPTFYLNQSITSKVNLTLCNLRDPDWSEDIIILTKVLLIED